MIPVSGNNHRADAAFREQLQQTHMRQATIQDHRAFHTALHRIDTVLHFRNHAASDHARGDIGPHIRHG